MARKVHTAEQIIAKLHEADVLQSHGKTMAEVVRRIKFTQTNIPDVTLTPGMFVVRSA